MEGLPFLLFFLSFSPLFTGYFATVYGRPFWKWFFIGMVLPCISFVLLYRATADDPPDEPPSMA
jgi:hypothetical protein